jgi:hypothetical protein
MTTKILLGRLQDNAGTFADGEQVFLEKHKWNCEWYWGFGYLGNSCCHFHFDSILKDSKTADELFKKTKHIKRPFSNKDWWILRDLFKQAYALKRAAEIYQYGGHQTTLEDVTDILKNAEKAKQLNADLEIILNKSWEFACSVVNR